MPADRADAVPAAFRVALTGGIGSGKSSVSDLFTGYGVSVIDADLIAHQLTAAGGEALPAIVAAFGSGVVDASGALDRAALRRLVFADAKARRRLEAILHPRIRARMQALAAQAPGPYLILAIPLLIETGQQSLADRVLVVDVPVPTQIARVAARSGLDNAEIERIIASQVSRAQRLALADDVIDNSGPLTALPVQVERLHRQYLDLSRR